MPAPYDASEFVDTDVSTTASPRTSPDASTRPPTREELEAQVSTAQQRLAELKRQQEELERERAAVEEARRRRVEFQTGREEMLQHLTRGVALMEESELVARRDAEQMTKSLGALRDALAKVQSLSEENWNKENWQTEMTRALTTLENARMEWNAARLKWPLLDGPKEAPATTEPAPAQKPFSQFSQMGIGELCWLGFALTWPVTVVVLVLIVVVLLRK